MENLGDQSYIDDMCKILKKSIEIEIPEKYNGTAFNMGVKGGNYTVKKLANLVKKTLPGTSIVFQKIHQKMKELIKLVLISYINFGKK